MPNNPLQKTMAARMLKRMESAELLHGEAIQDLKTLRTEAISKHDQTGRAAVQLGRELQADPDNRRLQREYAGAVSARKMLHHAANLDDALLEQEGEKP